MHFLNYLPSKKSRKGPQPTFKTMLIAFFFVRKRWKHFSERSKAFRGFPSFPEKLPTKGAKSYGGGSGKHGKDGKHKPDALKPSIYDSKHSTCDSNHPICQPDDSKHSILRRLWRRLTNRFLTNCIKLPKPLCAILLKCSNQWPYSNALQCLIVYRHIRHYCVRSVSSLYGGASSISDGIFGIKGVSIEVVNAWNEWNCR